MDENEVIIVAPVARLHDRWSLLSFAILSVHDMMNTATSIVGVAGDMALEHCRQKRYDRRFKEIVEVEK